MNTTQPEALQLAECCEHGYPLSDEAIRAAAELRRLHAENETLRAGYAAARLEIESLRSQAPQQEAQEPCPTCAALARTVMLDQVSFDRKPDCYGIRQITDDESVEEWEDIRTSPDVAREEANDMMATGRGEIYEVVPLWTTPQLPTAQAADSVQEDAARYRWLAANCRSTSEHWGGRWSIVIEGPAPKSHNSEDDFDAAVDAARKQGASQ